jgi:hypothetical protein
MVNTLNLNQRVNNETAYKSEKLNVIIKIC